MKKHLENLAREMETNLKNNILSWWMEHTPDHENGGFVGQVKLQNQVVENAPRGGILNARILWTFSAAYSMFRNEEYLAYATRAYEYNLEHFINPVFGGVYWEIDFTGKALNPRNQIYALAFMIYAMAEYYHITHEERALETAKGLFALIEKHSFDPQRNGYIEAFGRDWTPIEDLRLSKKDLNASKTMNTHLHILEAYTNLYKVWKCDETENALENIIRLFVDRFINLQTHHLNLFFDDDWNNQSDLISYGHDIECSWLLYEAVEVLGNKELLSEVKQIAINIARQNFTGLEKDNGLLYEYFPSEDRFDTDKHWWPQAEAIVGYLNVYQVSGEDIFARKALDNWEFIKNYMIDHQDGEWFLRVNRHGIPYLDDDKAGNFRVGQSGRSGPTLFSDRGDLVGGLHHPASLFREGRPRSGPGSRLDRGPGRARSADGDLPGNPEAEDDLPLFSRLLALYRRRRYYREDGPGLREFTRSGIGGTDQGSPSDPVRRFSGRAILRVSGETDRAPERDTDRPDRIRPDHSLGNFPEVFSGILYSGRGDRAGPGRDPGAEPVILHPSDPGREIGRVLRLL